MYYDAIRSFDPTVSQEDFFAGKLDADLLSEKSKTKLYKDLKRQQAALARKEAREAVKAEKAALVEAQRADADDLFLLWQQLFNRGKSSFTKTRRWHVSLALSKFSRADCELVLRTAAADPNTRGQNKLNRPFDDLPNIFRNEERVEMYLQMAQLTNRRTPNLVPDEGPARSERY